VENDTSFSTPVLLIFKGNIYLSESVGGTQFATVGTYSVICQDIGHDCKERRDDERRPADGSLREGIVSVYGSDADYGYKKKNFNKAQHFLETHVLEAEYSDTRNDEAEHGHRKEYPCVRNEAGGTAVGGNALYVKTESSEIAGIVGQLHLSERHESKAAHHNGRDQQQYRLPSLYYHII
jgi:UDP-N-acetylenolpyruvoylglucosamine reductase